MSAICEFSRDSKIVVTTRGSKGDTFIKISVSPKLTKRFIYLFVAGLVAIPEQYDFRIPGIVELKYGHSPVATLPASLENAPLQTFDYAQPCESAFPSGGLADKDSLYYFPTKTERAVIGGTPSVIILQPRVVEAEINEISYSFGPILCDAPGHDVTSVVAYLACVSVKQ